MKQKTNWTKRLYKYRKVRENKSVVLFQVFSISVFLLVIDLVAIIVAQTKNLNFVANLGVLGACLLLGVSAVLLIKTYREIQAIDELYLKVAGGKL